MYSRGAKADGLPSGLDVLPLELAGLAVGGTSAVIGFFQISVWFGHGSGPRADFGRILDAKTLYGTNSCILGEAIRSRFRNDAPKAVGIGLRRPIKPVMSEKDTPDIAARRSFEARPPIFPPDPGLGGVIQRHGQMRLRRWRTSQRRRNWRTETRRYRRSPPKRSPR